jgi:hypothetical protein
MSKSKTNYTKGALTEFIRGLAQLEGYENPARFLDEKLDEVREFKDFEFECDFFLNVHYLCKENAHEFWRIGHRNSISKWLIKSSILTDVFNTTWEFWVKSPYELEPEQFYFRARGEFMHEGLYNNEETFISNQLERLNLLIDKYKMSIVSGTKVNITQKQFIRLKQYRDYFISITVSGRTETRTDRFKTELTKYHFFELSKVKQLSEPNQQNLIELLSNNKMPYGIAMFDELGFCEFLDKELGTKYKTDKILSRLYNPKAKDGTSAKHYRRSLVKVSDRYKAGEHKETVKSDYEKLK